MKHHLYQIYYGGFKHLLKNQYYCKLCNQINTKKQHRELIQLQLDIKQRHSNEK